MKNSMKLKGTLKEHEGTFFRICKSIENPDSNLTAQGPSHRASLPVWDSGRATSFDRHEKVNFR